MAIPRKHLVCLSGGLDSTVLLSRLLAGLKGQQATVETVSFDYGSKHNKWESPAAQAVAEYFKLHHNLLELDFISRYFKSNLLQSGGAVPEGHYEEETMKQTVVPARNLIFLSVLAGYAWSRGFTNLHLGVHAGDHFIYPDCRPEFMSNAARAVYLGTDHNVMVETPLLFLMKKDIVKIGISVKAPFELTRTCYKDQEIACGKCGSCQERLEAFHLNEVSDPIEYESRELIPKEA